MSKKPRSRKRLYILLTLAGLITSTYDADDPHYWFFTNVEDPNDRGYDAIRRAFLNTIVEKSQLVPMSGATES